MSKDLTEDFRTAIENDSMATECDEIETRACASDNYSGIEYNFFGHYVPVRPIIDVVARNEGYRIEQIGHIHDGEHTCLSVFVATIEEEEELSPAFV
jgi:hypothetical protein